MKTYKRLYERICSFDNLLLAAKRAQAGKRFRPNVAQFNFHLERELLQLQEELLTQEYRPGAYRQFYIYEPKKRLISAAPYRDRVVHHALCNIIEPIFDRTCIFDSYACRLGKGTHKAANRFTKFCRKYAYVLKCDIYKYFPSIDHEVLYSIIAKKIRCKPTLWLIKKIIDASGEQEKAILYFQGDDLFTPVIRAKGLPIGNLTSQFFANVYLNGFDHYVKETLRCDAYIRYVDDFVALSNEKSWLHSIKAQMEKYLSGLRLKLHPHKCEVFPTKDGADFIGYRIFPTHRLLRKDNVNRAKRRLRKLQESYASGDITLDRVRASVQSWIAHASHADTYHLRKKIMEEVRFAKAS